MLLYVTMKSMSEGRIPLTDFFKETAWMIES
jgi:hypothetical protein